jgi:hypothetical protein
MRHPPNRRIVKHECGDFIVIANRRARRGNLAPIMRSDRDCIVAMTLGYK